MVSLQWVAVVLGFAIVLGCAATVYRDAIEVDVSRPYLWAGFLVTTCGGGLGLFLSPLDAPVPGLLMMVLAGPVLYLFERDDAKHGDAPADPHSLSDDSNAGESAERRTDN